jgi:PIN domain nuclease of toxin-antitoxin system
MNALLLDTHIWLWYAEGITERLPPSSVKILDDARKREGLLVSAISVWEIGAQSAKGRIQLSIPLRDWVAKALDVPGIHMTALDAVTAAESTLLPGQPHGDPADRFLIATARAHGVTVATRDKQIIEYGKSGFLRVIEL